MLLGLLVPSELALRNERSTPPMSDSRLFMPFLAQFRAQFRAQFGTLPRRPDPGLPSPMPGVGRSLLTPDDLELATAVFSPAFYRGDGQSADAAFRHFVTAGIHEAVAPSPLFDPLVYAERSAQAGHPLSPGEAASFFHWLRHGKARRIVPTALFDEAFYRDSYPGVAASFASGFTHFLLRGMSESRAPNATFDVAGVLASPASSAAWSLLDAYVQLHGREPDDAPEPAASHPRDGYTLAWRWRAGAACRAAQDDPLRRYFAGIDFDGEATLAWVKLVGCCWPLPERLDAIEAVAARVRANGLFDAVSYRLRAGLADDLDPALHYVLVGEALGLPPSDEFDPDYYAKRNSDVMRQGMNLLLHYDGYGRAEGRHGHAPAVFHANPQRFDPARDNVIVVVHETSRTGAPILGWNIIRHLAARYNVFTVRLGDGPLTPAFEALSAETHGPFPRSQRHPVDIEHGLRPLFAGRTFRYAIVNSSESRPLLEPCARHLVPTLLLMHEFGSYVHPAASLRDAFDWATEIVFSAPIVARSSEAVHPALLQRTIRILPQGMAAIPAGDAPAKPPPTARLEALALARAAGTFIVIGAGTVDLRKGVDLFLAAAAAARRHAPGRPVQFVWVGHGYRPDEDLGYSIYLREQLRRSRLEDTVTFLGEVSDLEPVYGLADAFLLASRLDPLPNVSIDAAHRGIPIVCFRDASGTADLMLADPGTAPGVVPHLDAEAAGRVIAHLATNPAARQRMADATARLARTLFDMGRYVDALDALGTALAPRAAQLQADAETLLADDSFDQDFHLGAGQVLEARERTVASYLAVHAWDRPGARRPSPGFDPRAWVAARPDGGEPLTAFIRAGRPAGPWQASVLRPAARVSPTPLRCVLHAHLPDPDLADALLVHLRPNTLACDLLVSTDTQAGAAQIRQALAGFGQGTVSVQAGPGDFASIVPHCAGYDLVGHVHAWPGDAHAVWREFQWQALLGGRHAMLDRILDAFAQSPELGLVVPAEPNDATATGGMMWLRAAALGEFAQHGAMGRLSHAVAHAVAHVPGVFW